MKSHVVDGLSRSLNSGTLMTGSVIKDWARSSNLYMPILKQGLHVNEGFKISPLDFLNNFKLTLN